MAQAVASLKLLTIARGFDRDFDDLHPKMLRRIHLGSMYSHSYTTQTGPLREVLAEAKGGYGNDWALAWTVETLLSEKVEEEKSGWFSTVEREIFKLDHFGDAGCTQVCGRQERPVVELSAMKTTAEKQGTAVPHLLRDHSVAGNPRGPATSAGQRKHLGTRT